MNRSSRKQILGALAVLVVIAATLSAWLLHEGHPVAGRIDRAEPMVTPARAEPVRLDDDTRGDASPALPAVASPRVVERTVASPAPDDDAVPCWIHVVDSASAIGLEHVKITAEFGVDQAISFTDALGRARVESSKKQPRLLQLDLDEYSTLYLEAVAGHERADRALLANMSRTATLRAHVRGATGAALQDTQITLEAGDVELRLRHLTRPDGSDPSFTSITANTDSSGNVTFEHLPAGIGFAATVFSPKPWSPGDPIVLHPGEVRDVDWVVSGGCTLRGLLLDQDDRPVTRRRVWMTQAWGDEPSYFVLGERDNVIATTTDESGRFMFAELDAAAWWAGPAPPAEEDGATLEPTQDVAPLAQIVRIEQGERTSEVTLHVDRGLYIRGHVLDSAGAPVADVHVRAVDRDRRLHSGASSRDPDGGFAIGPLARGTYLLSTQRQTKDAAAQPIVARTGDSDVVLRLRAGAALSGQVVNTDGTGASAVLRVADPSADPEEAATIHTDQNGRFTLRGLPPGVFDLVATTEDDRIGLRERVRVGGGDLMKDLVVSVTQGGRVRIHNAGPEPHLQLSVFHGGVPVTTRFAQGNSPVDVTVPPGRSVIRVAYLGTEGRVVERSISVGSGETVDLVLEAGAK